MKIAVITDDGKTISRHFGRAQQYLVTTAEDGKVIAEELRDKSGHHNLAASGPTCHEHEGAHGMDPASQDRHARMLGAIQDCSVLIAGGMGQGMYLALREAGIRPVLTDATEIRGALQDFLAGHLVDRAEFVH